MSRLVYQLRVAFGEVISEHATTKTSLELSDTQVYEPWIRARLGTTAHFWFYLQLPSACERGGNNYKGFKDFRTENGSSQGQNLAVTGVSVPDPRHLRRGHLRHPPLANLTPNTVEQTLSLTGNALPRIQSSKLSLSRVMPYPEYSRVNSLSLG